MFISLSLFFSCIDSYNSSHMARNVANFGLNIHQTIEHTTRSSLLPQDLHVGGCNPFEKYQSNWIIPPSRGKNEKICETTTQFNVLLFMAKGKHEGLVVQPHGIDWMIFLPNSWDFWRRNPGPKPKIHRSLTLTSSTQKNKRHRK